MASFKRSLPRKAKRRHRKRRRVWPATMFPKLSNNPPQASHSRQARIATQSREKNANPNPTLLRPRIARRASTPLRIIPGVPAMIAAVTVAMTARASITAEEAIAAAADAGGGGAGAGAIVVAVNKAVPAGG